MIKLSELILKEGLAIYPADHQPGMRVTKGGSMCANCEYWVAEGNKCNNKYWLKWKLWERWIRFRRIENSR